MSARGPQSQEWMDQQSSLWFSLGVDPEIVCCFSQELQFEFKQGRIWYSSETSVHEVADTLTTALTSV